MPNKTHRAPPRYKISDFFSSLLESGAVYPPHRHNDIEEVYMLDGDLLVEGVHMRSGDYCRSEPGSIHGEAKTHSGALLLVFSSQQDELLA